MGKWPLWIGTTLLAVAGLQLAMIFVLPSLPIDVSSEKTPPSTGDAPGEIAAAAQSATTQAAPTADLPLYTACVRETSKHPMRLAAASAQGALPDDRQRDLRRVDMLFVFSVDARSATAQAAHDRVVMRAPAQFGVVMYRSVVAHGREDGAQQAADCMPF